MDPYQNRVAKLETSIFDELNATVFSDFLLEASKHFVVNKALNAISDQEENKRKVYQILTRISEKRENIACLKQQLVAALTDYEETLKADLEAVRQVKAGQNELTESIKSGSYKGLESKEKWDLSSLENSQQRWAKSDRPSSSSSTPRLNPFNQSRFRTAQFKMEFACSPIVRNEATELEVEENIPNEKVTEEYKPLRRSISSPSLKYSVNQLPPTPPSLKTMRPSISCSDMTRFYGAGPSRPNYDDSVIMAERQTLPTSWKSPFRPIPMAMDLDRSSFNNSMLSTSNTTPNRSFYYAADKENRRFNGDTSYGVMGSNFARPSYGQFKK